ASATPSSKRHTYAFASHPRVPAGQCAGAGAPCHQRCAATATVRDAFRRPTGCAVEPPPTVRGSTPLSCGVGCCSRCPLARLVRCERNSEGCSQQRYGSSRKVGAQVRRKLTEGERPRQRGNSRRRSQRQCGSRPCGGESV